MRTIEKKITVYLDGRNDDAEYGDMAIEKNYNGGYIMLIRNPLSDSHKIEEGWSIIDYRKNEVDLKERWGL